MAAPEVTELNTPLYQRVGENLYQLHVQTTAEQVKMKNAEQGDSSVQQEIETLRGKLDSRDDFLQRAMEYGRGIRVLRQDEWEMLVSFIISQRKSIPAIRRAVELLSERFGERLGSDSEGPVYAFPTAEALCCAGEQALQECGLGYRTRYVLHAAQQAAEGTLDLKKLASLPDEALFARLMELDGVGKKVANCVCLFGYGRVGRVPVDVWIERLIRDEFAGQDPFPQFGLEAGIVQQYLFFYKRSVG